MGRHRISHQAVLSLSQGLRTPTVPLSQSDMGMQGYRGVAPEMGHKVMPTAVLTNVKSAEQVQTYKVNKSCILSFARVYTQISASQCICE